MSGRRAQSLLLGLCCLLGPALIGVSAALLSAPRLLLFARDAHYRPFGHGAVAVAALFGLVAAFQALRSQRLQRGTPGRLRGLLVGYGFALCAAALGGTFSLVLAVAPQLPSGSLITLEEAILLSPSSARNGLIACLSLALAGAVGRVPVRQSAAGFCCPARFAAACSGWSTSS